MDRALLNLLWFLQSICFVFATHYVTWEGGYLSDDYPERIVKYVYFYTKINWNEARQICQELGGDLAKVNSQHELDTIVHVYRETYPAIDLRDDFWIGLFDRNEESRIWAMDCSPLAFKSNFVEEFHEDHRCFKLKADTDYVGTRRDCRDNSPFLCELHPGKTCPFIPLIPDSSFMTYYNINTYSTCETKCANDDTCTAALFVSPSSCYQLKSKRLSTTNLDRITMGSKFCMNFRINTTVVQPIQNDNQMPESPCGIQLESMIDASPITINPTKTSPVISMTESSSVECVFPSDTLYHTVFTTVHVFSQYTLLSTINTGHTTTVERYESCTVPTVSVSPTVNLTDNDVLKIAEEISKNLTVDSKTTSSYLRKLTSANDSRRTSTAVGVVGIVSIAIPLLLILSADVRRLCVFLKIIKR